MYDRVEVGDNEAEPLTDEENKRIEYLVAKVDRFGSTSVLTDEEIIEYNRLGKRRNNTDGLIDRVSLPTAIKPWVTQ